MSIRKAFGLILLLIILSFNGSASLNSTIAESCPDNYQGILSMANPDATFSNPGPPGLYQYNVCVTGITEVEIRNQCRDTPAFYLSSDSTDAHFSNTKGYNMEVCTGRMITRVKDSCLPNQTALFKVSEPINGQGRHVSGLDSNNPYNQFVCGFYAPPSNISYSLDFNLSNSDEVYFDDEQKTSEFTKSTLAEFPYLVSVSSQHIAGLVANSYVEASREIDGTNKLTLKREAGKNGVIIPLTPGDTDTIEDKQGVILDNRFLNQLYPSFNFFTPSTPVVRVVLASDAELVSNLSIGAGGHNIQLEKTGDNEITISER